MWLQEVAISVWPTDVEGWVKLIGGILTIMSITGLAVGKWLDNRIKQYASKVESKTEKAYIEAENEINGLGTRVNECHSGWAEMRGKLEKVEYDMQGFRYRQEQVSKEITIVNESVKELEKALRSHTEQTAKDIRAMSESVVRMEGMVSGAVNSMARRREENESR